MTLEYIGSCFHMLWCHAWSRRGTNGLQILDTKCASLGRMRLHAYVWGLYFCFVRRLFLKMCAHDLIDLTQGAIFCFHPKCCLTLLPFLPLFVRTRSECHFRFSLWSLKYFFHLYPFFPCSQTCLGFWKVIGWGTCSYSMLIQCLTCVLLTCA